MWEPIIDSIGRYFIPTMIFLAVVVHTVVRGLVDLVRTVAREQTRREIAAYVASGSMTPDQGERLMAAKDPSTEA